jgi:hypothetical protein
MVVVVRSFEHGLSQEEVSEVRNDLRTQNKRGAPPDIYEGLENKDRGASPNESKVVVTVPKAIFNPLNVR